MTTALRVTLTNYSLTKLGPPLVWNIAITK